MAGCEYNITVRGVTANCGGPLLGRDSEPLTITPQGKLILCLPIHLMFNASYLIRYATIGMHPGLSGIFCADCIAVVSQGSCCLQRQNHCFLAVSQQIVEMSVDLFIFIGPPSAPTLSLVDLSEDVSGAVNVTVSWWRQC